MRPFRDRVKLFFTSISSSSLKSSTNEVLWLTFFALLPFTIYIIISGISINNIIEAFKSKVIPGEILSYCFGFLAPTMYLFLVRTKGTTYKLPFLHFISMLILLVYGLTVALYLIVKNKWVPQINMEQHGMDLYFQLVVLFLIVSICLRIYSVYHGKRILNWQGEREQQQDEMNRGFSNGLNAQQ